MVLPCAVGPQFVLPSEKSTLSNGRTGPPIASSRNRIGVCCAADLTESDRDRRISERKCDSGLNRAFDWEICRRRWRKHHGCARRSAAVELCPRILIKRDDLTGLAFGGNKTRKLEFLVADALARQATVLITSGAVQSNHARLTAAAARVAGLRAVLVLDTSRGAPGGSGEPAARPAARSGDAVRAGRNRHGRGDGRCRARARSPAANGRT